MNMTFDQFHAVLNLISFFDLLGDSKRDAFVALKAGHKREYSKHYNDAFGWKHDYETVLDVFNLFFDEEIKNFVAVHKSLRRHDKKCYLFMFNHNFERIVNYCKGE